MTAQLDVEALVGRAASRIVREFRLEGWPAKEAEIARLLAATFEIMNAAHIAGEDARVAAAVAGATRPPAPEDCSYCATWKATAASEAERGNELQERLRSRPPAPEDAGTVERVARKLCKLEYPDQPESWHEGAWDGYIDDAKAVIAALSRLDGEGA